MHHVEQLFILGEDGAPKAAHVGVTCDRLNSSPRICLKYTFNPQSFPFNIDA